MNDDRPMATAQRPIPAADGNETRSFVGDLRSLYRERSSLPKRNEKTRFPIFFSPRSREGIQCRFSTHRLRFEIGSSSNSGHDWIEEADFAADGFPLLLIFFGFGLFFGPTFSSKIEYIDRPARVIFQFVVFLTKERIFISMLSDVSAQIAFSTGVI